MCISLRENLKNKWTKYLGFGQNNYYLWFTMVKEVISDNFLHDELSLY